MNGAIAFGDCSVPSANLSAKTFTTLRACVSRSVIMALFIKRFALFLFPLLLVGCASNSITNLTPSSQRRNAEGLYPVEAYWKSNQQSLKKETIRAYVMVGLESYPMKPTAMLENRWEIDMPIPADQKTLFYRFKFDYEYRGMPGTRSDSLKSQEFRLDIFD